MRLPFPLFAVILALILVGTAVAAKPGTHRSGTAEDVGDFIALTADPDRHTRVGGVIVYLLPAGGHFVIGDADGDGIFEGEVRDDPRAEFARMVIYVGGKHKWQDICTCPIER